MLISGPDPDYYNQMHDRWAQAINTIVYGVQQRRDREQREYETALKMLNDNPEIAEGAWGDKFVSRFGRKRPEASAMVDYYRQKLRDRASLFDTAGQTLDEARQLELQRTTDLQQIPQTVISPPTREQIDMGGWHQDTAGPKSLADAFSPRLEAVGALPGQTVARNPAYAEAMMAQNTGPSPLEEAISRLPGPQQIEVRSVLEKAKVPIPGSRFDVQKFTPTQQAMAAMYGPGSELAGQSARIAGGLELDAGEQNANAQKAADAAQRIAEAKQRQADSLEAIAARHRAAAEEISQRAGLKGSGKGKGTGEPKVEAADVTAAAKTVLENTNGALKRAQKTLDSPKAGEAERAAAKAVLENAAPVSPEAARQFGKRSATLSTAITSGPWTENMASDYSALVKKGGMKSDEASAKVNELADLTLGFYKKKLGEGNSDEIAKRLALGYYLRLREALLGMKSSGPAPAR